ncbi:hypothetical protein BGZ95_006210 [Linnemannia exigua]|uniref:Uncharacterized protein n=1 Tax=Linnemannia exigua TaxID=604196 RepID=A0AAD4H0W9_9FUNG|nr:hypothetical protein BGZ95_006210 [Linnemannia exigua]
MLYCGSKMLEHLWGKNHKPILAMAFAYFSFPTATEEGKVGNPLAPMGTKSMANVISDYLPTKYCFASATFKAVGVADSIKILNVEENIAAQFPNNFLTQHLILNHDKKWSTSTRRSARAP